MTNLSAKLSLIFFRFHPTRDEDKIQWNGTWDPCDLNVKSGLVVDRTITHPLALDFYLQSLNPIVGTGRAAHHFCLTNDMYLSTADLQAVTRNYAYDKGISYCAPA